MIKNVVYSAAEFSQLNSFACPPPAAVCMPTKPSRYVCNGLILSIFMSHIKSVGSIQKTLREAGVQAKLSQFRLQQRTLVIYTTAWCF